MRKRKGAEIRSSARPVIVSTMARRPWAAAGKIPMTGMSTAGSNVLYKLLKIGGDRECGIKLPLVLGL